MPSVSDDQTAAIKKAVQDNFPDQISFTQKLIRFGGQRGEEHTPQQFFYDELSKRGYNPIKFDMDAEALKQHVGAGKISNTHSWAPIVIGTHKPKTQAEGGRSLILNGHMDVVPLGPRDMWKDDPYSAKIEGDKMYGRGTGDMRGGHASKFFVVVSSWLVKQKTLV
jgi:acetylornithine deacetylase